MKDEAKEVELEYEVVKVATQTRLVIQDKDGNVMDELTALMLLLNKVSKLERGLL